MKWGTILVAALCLQAAGPACSRQQPQQRHPPVQTAVPATADTSLPRTAVTDDSLARTNDVARMLAGLRPADSAWCLPLLHSAAWQRHAREMDTRWASFMARQGDPIRSFAATHLADMQRETRTLFYPFSGPDFAYAAFFFPEARHTIMLGLEPVGVIPAVTGSEADLSKNLGDIRTSLGTVLGLSFFKTDNMKVDLVRGRWEGVVPLVLTLMARTGMTIRGVDLVHIDSLGVLHPTDTAARPLPAIPGVVFRYSAPGERLERDATYFSCNVIDQSMAALPGFARHIGGIDVDASFFKAASYLCHNDYFSVIRTLALKARWLLQDDSGIAMKYLPAAEWDFTWFGRYTGTIGLFARRRQTALDSVFRQPGITPLPFGIGYKYRAGESNLMLGRRKAVGS